jgi:Flp pilus assembly pilin Flp
MNLKKALHRTADAPELVLASGLLAAARRRYRAARDEQGSDAGSIISEYAILLAVIAVAALTFIGVVVALIVRKTDLFRNL